VNQYACNNDVKDIAMLISLIIRVLNINCKLYANQTCVRQVQLTDPAFQPSDLLYLSHEPCGYRNKTSLTYLLTYLITYLLIVRLLAPGYYVDILIAVSDDTAIVRILNVYHLTCQLVT